MSKLTDEQVLDAVLEGITLAALWSSYRSIEHERAASQPALWHTRRQFVVGLHKLPMPNPIAFVLAEVLQHHSVTSGEQLLSDYGEDN